MANSEKKNFVSTPSNLPSMSIALNGLALIGVSVAVIYGVVWVIKNRNNFIVR